MNVSRRLILVDGMAALYRAFYAIRDLSTSDGRPTNAVFGFVRMMRQLRDTWSPTHWAVVFDGGSPAARLELLEEYKSQRKPMPDPLREQVAVSEEYLDRGLVFRTRIEGQEADDVMASIGERAAREGADVLIATNDKDMYQVVGDRVRMVPLAGKKGSLGAEEIKAKTGVQPEQIVEWLALTGDTADNIPGVPGVGAKTAASLLERFGHLEEMWRRIDEIPRERLRETLLDHRDIVARNLAMVRLARDLDCFPGWDAMRVRPPSPELARLFRDLEFDSMAREIEQPGLL